jgi:hypothetical protein
MIHNFQSIDNFLFSIEEGLIELLYQHDLLKKFDANVKKVIFYVFVKSISERLNDTDLLFYHNGTLSDNHELFHYFDREKLEIYINKLCHKVKNTTNKLFFLKQKITLPPKSLIHDLDGSVIDEIFILKEKRPVDPRVLKDFLEKNHLKDLFCKLSKKIC